MSGRPGPAPLLIRADAGPRIGNGHVMRCLALAQAWQDAGGEVTFACAELSDRLRKRLEAERFRVTPVSAAPGSVRDAERLKSLGRKQGAKVIVLDGYHLGSNYQRIVRSADFRLIVIDDDGCHGSYHADVILNQNLHADAGLYPRRPASTRLLLGPRYALLRREFRDFSLPRRRFPEVARRILVLVGGTGVGSAITRTLRSVARVVGSGGSVMVVSPGDADGSAIRRLAGEPPIRLTSVLDPPDLPQRMAWADAVVTAAGSTIWELLSLGVPMLAFPIAANQRPIAKWLERERLALVASPYTRRSFEKAFTRLLNDAALRRILSRRGRSAVCSREGAAQVVTSLLTDVNP